MPTLFSFFVFLSFFLQLLQLSRSSHRYYYDKDILYKIKGKKYAYQFNGTSLDFLFKSKIIPSSDDSEATAPATAATTAASSENDGRNGGKHFVWKILNFKITYVGIFVNVVVVIVVNVVVVVVVVCYQLKSSTCTTQFVLSSNKRLCGCCCCCCFC